MNNEISFDSEKFSISKLEKMRPQETIDNLNEFAPEDDDENNLSQKNFEHSDVRPSFYNIVELIVIFSWLYCL